MYKMFIPRRRKQAGKRKQYRKRRVARKAFRFGSKATLIKRIGQQCRIGNSTVSGNPVATANGNGMLTVGTASADTLNTLQVGASLQFSLNQAEDYGDIVSLFDRYKLVGVKLKMLYQSNIANADSTSGSNALPIVSYAIDLDDAVVPTAQTQVTRKQYCHQKILNGNYQVNVYVKPRLASEIYNGTLSSAYAPIKPVWLDATNDSVPHYGLKLWLNNWTGGATKFNQLTITPTFYFMCKDTQ